jgi:hypothetical protein
MKEEKSMKMIKVAKVPGTAVEVAVEANATIEEILETAGIDATGYDIRVGDASAFLTDVPADGAKIYLTQQLKGNL